MENTNTVPCVWVACSCNALDSCNKCGGAGGKYLPIKRVRVTTPPWTDQLGTIESVDGAYNIIRLDSSQHPDDVQELYPNEFVVLCHRCEHDEHEPGQCKVLHIYARGPNDPPGNQGCLCGVDLKTVTTNSNNWGSWENVELEE